MAATATKKKSKIKLQPLGDKVVVEREEAQDVTAGGIVLPDSAKDKPSRGTIVAVGTGKTLDDGSRGEMQVKVGDRVPLTQGAGPRLLLAFGPTADWEEQAKGFAGDDRLDGPAALAYPDVGKTDVGRGLLGHGRPRFLRHK